MSEKRKIMSTQQESPVAVVTGASSGIGKAVATEMLAAGYRVVLSGRREEALHAVAQNRANALVILTDVTDAVQVDQLFESVVDNWGRHDDLLHQGGIAGPAAHYAEPQRDEWDALLAWIPPPTAKCGRAGSHLKKKANTTGRRNIHNGEIAAQPRSSNSLA